MPIKTPSRRAVIAMIATLPLSDAGAAPEGVGANPIETKSRTLVAYFSRSGNTRVIAGVIQRAQKADLFEIRPASAYPEDYFETVEQARQQRDSGKHPALAARVRNIALYDTVFLGFPIWGETIPPVVKTFLSQHELSGKTLVPFVTHGGFGLGDSQVELIKRAKGARLSQAFVIEADQERRTTTQVQEWLGSIKAA